MDNDLIDAITNRMPVFNQEVVDGLAVAEMEHVESYVDRVWRCAAADFPAGLTYDGYYRLSPKEEYIVNSRRGSSPATLEIARSDVYMVAYKLSWQGAALPPCHVNLPIVDDGGIIHIRGAKYSICPVLADVAISVGTDSIFIPLLRDRITFMRLLQHFYSDGIRQSVYVVWSNIHHGIAKGTKANGSRIVTTMAHYLFAKYGVTGTFAKYANAHVVVGRAATVNRETYPPSDWVLCSSTHHKPLKVKDKNYIPSDVIIAIPRPEWSDSVANLVAGFFYVADYFPQRIIPEDVDETYLWCALLGISIWGWGISEGRLADDVESHLNSLDGYVDNEARNDMREEGVPVQDLYDLFMYLIDNFTRRVVEAHANLPSMYDKRLMVLRYVMKDLVKSINIFMYRVKANQKKQLTLKDLAERLSSEINPNVVLKINSKHGEVDTGVSSPGDNKYFKITGRIVKQVNSSGPRARTISMTDPANFLHSSIPECGSYLTPSGASPTGHERINPCIELGPGRVIVRHESTRELLDDVERRIRRT
jgi:hypothetical protein